jgi:F-type H+-transporting ATPase subunit b
MPRQPVLILGFLAALALALAPAARSQTPKHAEPAHAATAPAQAEGGHAEPGHAGAEANPDILEPQPSLAIWTAVVFLVLLLVLYKFAWGPLSRALHQREEHMEHVLLDAEKARNESERLLAEHRKQMATAADQVRALIEEARRDAQATADEIIRKAQAEAEASRDRAQREIGLARDEALVEIWSKTADLAVSVAGRVLSRELNQDDHRRLVASAMGELPASPTANGAGSRNA